MAARLTDRQKKKIVADYARLESYSAAAKVNGVSHHTVKACVAQYPDFAEQCQDKKEQNTADVLAYLESQRGLVCDIIGLGLKTLNDPEKLAGATPAQITTMIGTLIDKWANLGGTADDPLYDLLDRWNDAALKVCEDDTGKSETT